MATYSARQIATLVKINPGPWNTKGRQVMAVAGALAESGGRTTVYNGICCFGLWQVNLSAHMSKIPGKSREAKIRYLKTAMGNMKVAQKIFVEAGNSWSPWEAITNGAYRRHLTAASKAVGGISQSDIQAIQAGNIPDWLEDPPGDWPTPSDPGGPFTDGLPSPGDIPGVDAIGDALGAIADAFSWIADPHNWLRIATFLAGGALIILVGVALLKDSSIGEVAMMAVTKGRGKLKSKGATKGAVD